MDIVINCLGMPFDGDTINKQSLGGSETAAYYMAKCLAEMGHNVTMFTRCEQQKTFDNVKYVPAGEQSEQHPLGNQFHFYAENTPHDVLIMQRAPQAFSHNYASKINLWWLHDLAMYRNKEAANAHLWNVNGVLVVSEYHKEQVSEVYGISKNYIHVIKNGVDLSLYEGEIDAIEKKPDTKYLLYSSRPERGLEHLVAPGGIMENLLDDNVQLIVCGYYNPVAHMNDYYNYLDSRIEQLPNCTNIGALTKKQLADLMRQMDLHVYPTPGPGAKEFREVSCITIMECMAAGLPMVTSDCGAIPETAKDGGVVMLPLNGEGLPDIDSFVDAIRDILKKPNLSHRQLECAPRNSWMNSAGALMDVVTLELCKKSPQALARHFIDNSDIPAFEVLPAGEDRISRNIEAEYQQCYRFYRDADYAQHYADYYEYEKERGVNYGPESLDGNLRFETVARLIGELPAGSKVLDYGCAHGHYTINLAKRFPNIRFAGYDIAASNVEKAIDWASSEELKNACFFERSISFDTPADDYDCVIAAEVVEHVGDYVELLTAITRQAKPGGKVIITTPYGPWEQVGYRQHWPWRAHLHHFDRKDIKEILSDFDDLNIVIAPSRGGLGSYIYDYTAKSEFTIHQYDMDRKITEAIPKQTVSLCMIAKDAEATMQQAIESVCDVVQEVIVAIDETTTDCTLNEISHLSNKYPDIAFKSFSIPSPLEIGFDEARNLSIEEACGDWVLWLDCDEKVIDPKNILKYLRNNEYLGYGMAQHHYSVEPLGVMKTDYPLRLFRNNKGIRFFGVVHEHPEIKLNEQVGRAHIIGDVDIMHTGYTTEQVRRDRFTRNCDLMRRDREKHPERTLGKYLWIRDLAQQTKYDLERGHCPFDVRLERSDEANRLFVELVEAGEIRMAVDAMDYYSFLNVVCDRGIKASFKVDFSKHGDPTLTDKKEVGGRWLNKEHINMFFNKIMEVKTENFDSPWY